MKIWEPGDDPTAHRLWPEQVNLELSMMRAGADAYLASSLKARRKDQMTRLAPYRRLMTILVSDVARGVKTWLRDYKDNAGFRPVSWDYILSFDLDLAAYVALRHILDHLSRGQVNVLSIATAIGSAMEHEARMDAWEHANPKLYYGVRRQLRRQGATQVHKRRVNVNRFNKRVREHVLWEPWPAEVRRRVGLDLLDVAVRYGRVFEVTKGQPTGKQQRLPIAIGLKRHVERKVLKALEQLEVSQPQYMPTVMPPSRWESAKGGGGYYTEYVRTGPLVRFKAHNEGMHSRALDDYDTLDMPLVYGTTNAIQEVPWRVDTKVLEVAAEAWKRDLAIAGLPLQAEVPLPPKPPVSAPEDEWRTWRRKASQVHAHNAERTTDALTTSRILKIANTFKRKVFYFPHYLDFRGRMYPKPALFSPQGRDLARGMMRFAEAKPISRTDGTYRWVAIHLANMYGLDKAPHAERLEFVESRETEWRAIAASPLTATSWVTDADKPWQALQAVFEWVAFLDKGDGFKSSLPCRVDGTCNGIQHLSAMTGDASGGASVNLLPSDRPQDIYADVAEALTERLKDVILEASDEGDQAALAGWWLDVAGDPLPRSLTKRQVMVLPYGATRDAYMKYTREWLEEYASEIVVEMDFRDVGRKVAFLSGHMWEMVREKVEGATAIMDWLKECAKHVAVAGQPIYWIAPSGFVVRHFYGKFKVNRIRTRIDDQVFSLVEKKATDALDTIKQLRGVSPNFVHSMDAAANTFAIEGCRQRGVRCLSPIHDCMGALAADMDVVLEEIKKGFVEVHEYDVLGGFRQSCLDMLTTHLQVTEGLSESEAAQKANDTLPPPLKLGKLDLHAVLESDYFFS